MGDIKKDFKFLETLNFIRNSLNFHVNSKLPTQ
jgi:hypothetical protein